LEAVVTTLVVFWHKNGHAEMSTLPALHRSPISELSARAAEPDPEAEAGAASPAARLALKPPRSKRLVMSLPRPPSPAVIPLPECLTGLHDQAGSSPEFDRARGVHQKFTRWQLERQAKKASTLSEQAAAKKAARGKHHGGDDAAPEGDCDLIQPPDVHGFDAPGAGAGPAGAGAPACDGDGAADDGDDDGEPATTNWVPGITTQFMENLFSRDVWKHVTSSSQRVAFCRRGGKCKSESFNDIRHDAQYLRVAQNAPKDKAEEEEKAAEKAAKDAAKAKRRRSTVHQSPRTARGKSDRETLIFMTAGNNGGARKASVHPPVVSAAGRHHADVPDPVITRVSLLEVRDDLDLPRAGKASSQSARRAPKLVRPVPTEEMVSVSRAIGAVNDEFRKMVQYRAQDTGARFTRSAAVYNSDRILDDGRTQHVAFQRHVHDECKTLYINGASEVERWSEDRVRMFPMMYSTMDVSNAECTWQHALARLRHVISSTLEAEFSQERDRLQKDFIGKFDAAARAAFRNLGADAEQILARLHAGLTCSKPFGPHELELIVLAVPPDSFFRDDVLSILYSLASTLAIPDAFWLDHVKHQTQFLAVRKEMTAMDDDSDSARWLLKARPADIGPSSFVWAMTLPAANSLSPDERLHFAGAYPAAKLVRAVVQCAHPLRLVPECRDAFIAAAALVTNSAGAHVPGAVDERRAHTTHGKPVDTVVVSDADFNGVVRLLPVLQQPVSSHGTKR
jgi:hypothetical protein